jgi:hypothetical protein
MVRVVKRSPAGVATDRRAVRDHIRAALARPGKDR